ncbi:hypothetical protein OBBRIDRAFT_789080 [Obba rivulosa]|uniref:HIG1 domain-containing protein n=1 Tax=Obba rivulosa TaxID=1052685 RepID=A0A8E2DS20_9APHY|nr:hypothetical protein OBBRIDRAFT_789080 [Obba rivulosa]
MSTQPLPAPAPPDAPEPELETFRERMIRKSRAEPLIPVGMALTVFALTGAIIQSRRRNPTSMNHWLRARIVAQGLTIAIVVAYAYRVIPARPADGPLPPSPAAARANADAEDERRAFATRLRAAEEEHAAFESARTAGSAAGPAATPPAHPVGVSSAPTEKGRTDTQDTGKGRSGWASWLGWR